jgi:hypothetical protein
MEFERSLSPLQQVAIDAHHKPRFFKFHFNIILQSVPTSSKWFLSFSFSK